MAAAGNREPRRARRPGGLLWQRSFLLLWQRSFLLLWTGETVSQTGNAMAVVGVPLLAVEVLHASTFAVSALTAAAYLPWLVIGLPAPLIDDYRRSGVFAVLGARTFRGGTATARLLARAHPSGRWVEWLGPWATLKGQAPGPVKRVGN